MLGIRDVTHLVLEMLLVAYWRCFLFYIKEVIRYIFGMLFVKYKRSNLQCIGDVIRYALVCYLLGIRDVTYSVLKILFAVH